MNAASYIFVEISPGELVQYPNDNTSSIFSKFTAHARGKQTIAIHRDGDLMYYGYIRQLEGGGSIGICIVLNGVMVSDIPRKFTYRPNYISQLFEDAINAIAESNTFISKNEDGDIELYDGIKELFSAYAGIEPKLNSLLENFGKLKTTILPPPSYKTPKGFTRDYKYNDNWGDILQSCHTNDYTYIFANPEQPSQSPEENQPETTNQTEIIRPDSNSESDEKFGLDGGIGITYVAVVIIILFLCAIILLMVLTKVDV